MSGEAVQQRLQKCPSGFVVGRMGMSYNVYFPGGQIAMAAPVDDDAVEYADGTKATKDQISRDVATSGGSRDFQPTPRHLPDPYSS